MSVETVAESLASGTSLENVVRAATPPTLVLHISAGIVAMLAGAAALLFHKGEAAHRTAGRAFFVSMLILGLSAPLIAESRLAVITGPLAAYFVATAWVSARRDDRNSGMLEVGAFVFASALAAAYYTLGAQAAASPTGRLDGFPAGFHYVFGTLAALAAALDLNAILRRRIAWAPRIARHLWRMCFAMALAAASFFIGQLDRFPAVVRESGFNAAVVLTPLALMLFWLARVRLMKQTTSPGLVAAPARLAGGLYLIAVGAGLFGLLLPRG